MVKFRMDRKTLKAEEGTSILEAAMDVGIHIPTLCYHPALEPVGACRLCMVELTRGERTDHVAACVTPVAEGVVVRTDTPAVRRMRLTVLDLLVSKCPEVGTLRELAESLGMKEPSYPLEDGTCYLCGICVRACREIVGAEAISITQRGIESEVLPPFASPSSRCIGCGTCTTVCPARTFELTTVDASPSLHGEGKDVRVRKCIVCEEHYTGS